MISTALHISQSDQLVLLTSGYLLGYIFGPMAFGPLSEIFGRATILVPTFFAFCAFTLGCALSPTWTILVVFRIITGVMASAPITIVGGVYADIYDNATHRGRAMAAFMAGNTFGPILGPLISGFAARLGWRWPFWITLMLAGASWLLLLLLPETYGPVLLKGAAKIVGIENTAEGHKAQPAEQKERGVNTWKVILIRPIRLLVLEPIVLYICTYLAFAFGIFYLFFEAYPIIFQGI